LAVGTAASGRAVCTIRDPLSVARSLAKRDRLSIAHAGALYAVTWAAIGASLQHVQTALVSFDDIFKDARAVLTLIAEGNSVGLPDDFLERVEAFEKSHLDCSLRHSSVPFSELKLEPELPPIAVEIYHSLLPISRGGDVQKTFRRLAAQRQSFRDLSPLVEEYDRIFGEQQKIPVLSARAELLQRELAEIKASTCWRLTWPVRKFGAPLRPLLVVARRFHRRFCVLFLHRKSGDF